MYHLLVVRGDWRVIKTYYYLTITTYYSCSLSVIHQNRDAELHRYYSRILHAVAVLPLFAGRNTCTGKQDRSLTGVYP